VPPGRRRPFVALVAAVAIAAAPAISGCGDSGSRFDPAPRPLGEAADLPGATVSTPREQAQAIAGNPRLLLFDLQTALESIRETRGAYPSQDEFRATDSWALQRAALDAAFDAWTYESDGTTYRLTGEAAGREFGIRSPE
jgi:hypothetical protein